MKTDADYYQKLFDHMLNEHNLTLVCNEMAEILRIVREMGQWQPIETAPKDGTPILIFTERGQYVADWAEFEIEYWHVHDGKFEPRPVRGPAPTHWIPLPDPPK